MDDITREALRSWAWRPFFIGALLLVGVLYTTGWRRLRLLRRGGPARAVRMATVWRLIAYWLGLLFIALALLSPIDTLSGLLFFMHMVQHLMLAMLAPPLLLLANPLPIVMWGVPRAWRRRVGRALFGRRSPIRNAIVTVTHPAAMYFLWVTLLWIWHDNALYSLALRNEFVHDLEHFVFFWTAMGLWWHITGAAPHFRSRLSYLTRFGMSIAAVPVTMTLGIVISFANQLIYTHYATVPRLWIQDPIFDQQLGGVIMWVPGSMMFILAAVVCVARWMTVEEARAAEVTPEELFTA